jgi:hypothetical protein
MIIYFDNKNSNKFEKDLKNESRKIFVDTFWIYRLSVPQISCDLTIIW